MDRAGPQALELGLLFSTEIPQEEEVDALCFQHIMLQEFAAAVFISVKDIVSGTPKVSLLVILISFNIHFSFILTCLFVQMFNEIVINKKLNDLFEAT